MSAVTDIACEKCGGSLYLDRESAMEVASRGFRGGRVFCVAGCTSVWLMRPSPPMAVPPPDGRAKYERRVCTVSCRVCERHYQTKPGRCKACRTEARRTRDRRRSTRDGVDAHVEAGVDGSDLKGTEKRGDSSTPNRSRSRGSCATWPSGPSGRDQNNSSAI